MRGRLQYMPGICSRPASEAQFVSDVRGRLLSAELMVRLKKLDIPPVDFSDANALARAASDALRTGTLSYSLVMVTATRMG
jgi:hypothetical protein